MAVYTDIHEDELQKYLNRYQIGELLSYRGIAEGVENSNFLLHTSMASFILTLYEKRVDPKDLPFFLFLMQHLAKKGISCPQPVVDSKGNMIGTLAGRPAAIVTFLEGIWVRKITAEHCRELGQGMAEMHLAGLDFDIKRANSLSMKNWRPLWNKIASRADEFEKGIGAEVERELDRLEADWPRDLPMGVIHADLFNDNVFFLQNHLSGIIDFYFACNDFLSYDIAICLNAWCFERDYSYNLTKANGLLSRYQKVRPLEKNEIEAMPLLARGAALRFFLTRLYDWFNTPENSLVTKKDPMEYWRKLNFFKGIKSANEMGL